MRYVRPQTMEDATALMAGAEANAFVLAGGTDLLVRMQSDTEDECEKKNTSIIYLAKILQNISPYIYNVAT